MPCIRIQMLGTDLETMDSVELLGRSSQCLADVLGGWNHYVMALWEPQDKGVLSGLKVDVMGLTENELPDRTLLSEVLSSLLKTYLPKLESQTELTIREGERSEWDDWEAGAVDGFRVVYGIYEPGRPYKKQS